MAAVVQQRAAAGERAVLKAWRHLRASGPVVGLAQPDERQTAQLPGLDHRARAFDRPIRAQMVVDLEYDARLATGGDHLVRLGERQRDGLLAQDVDAGGRGRDRRRVVGRVRGADRHGIEARQCQQVPEVPEDVPNGPLERASLERRGVRVRDGNDLCAGRDVSLDVVPGDVPAPMMPTRSGRTGHRLAGAQAIGCRRADFARVLDTVAGETA